MYRGVKRIADLLFALVAIVIAGPLLLVLALAIRLDSAGPVFFLQRRAGRDGTFFRIVKFRTMRTDTPADMPTHLLKGADSHITRVGRFLRKSSLDELPQLINILAGHMSLVGPRPALWNQEDLIALRQANGSSGIRPGLTGWAQVNGRDELPIEVKADLDGYYAVHCGPALDLKILWLTARQVIRGSGVVEGQK